ncbi:MAG: hypothetical protein JJU29_23765 [Verrucomicrobia bacterium]|nr:hypothetical protein [Verrucomicrobiota bacterium]
MPALDLKYQRPTSLSDPFDDFTEDMLAEILKTPDEKMTRCHYQHILGPFLPAGTYEEAAYFLPRAFDHIRSHDDDALDLVTSLAWFISEFQPRLESDGTIGVCRDLMESCFDQWTAEFKVVHFDHAACQKKGWGLRYFDYVKHSETIAAGTCDLIRFTANADLATRLYQRVARESASPVEAAWFLEFSRQHFSTAVRKPPKHGEITKIIEDQEIAERSAQLVASGLEGFADFPSYWRDTFNGLAIESVPIPAWAEQ